MTKVRVKVSEPSHSVIHDGNLYRFRFAESMTISEIGEWVRQADGQDPQSRSAILEIDGNPTTQYPDELVDACVAELRRFYKRVFPRSSLKRLERAMKRLPSLSVLQRTPVLDLPRLPALDVPRTLAFDLPRMPAFDAPRMPFLDLPRLPFLDVPRLPALDGPAVDFQRGLGEGSDEPLLVHSPQDRVVDAIDGLRDSLREEEVPVAHAGLRWIRDRVLPGVIVGLFMFALGWAANEFFG